MNKYWLLFLLNFYPLTTVLCQGCFSDADKRLNELEKTGVKYPERNNIIKEGLLDCQAPDFIVKTISGEPISLAELSGKVVVINFWFTSCAPCITEMPALNRLVDEFKGKDVVFIALAKDDAQELARFLDKRQFNFNIVASTNKIAISYCIDIFGWPTSMVVDKGGIVRKISSGGYLDERAETYIYNELHPVIESYLD